MLRRVKLFIENTAFDDFRILQKRGSSGIPLAMTDSICKKIKSNNPEDIGNPINANEVPVNSRYSSIEILANPDLRSKLSPSKFSVDTTQAQDVVKKSCEIWLDGSKSAEM